MSISPQRAQALHRVDEAWTRLIDRLGDNWPEATEQLRVLHRWKDPLGNGPPWASMGPVTTQRLMELAWLAMSEAALRATDDRNYGNDDNDNDNDDEGERVPCI